MNNDQHTDSGKAMPVDGGIARRELLRRAGLVGASVAAGAAAGPLAAPAFGDSAKKGSYLHPGKGGRYLVPRNRIAMGMVTYSFATSPPPNIYSVLDEIRDIGYRGVELFELRGFTGGIARAQQVRQLLADAGLHGISNMHYYGFGGSDYGNSLDRFIAEDKAAGMENIAFVAHRTTPETQTEAYYKELAAKFNVWGAAAKQAGMKFTVHNEQWVFDRDPTTGKVLYDVWIEETDPDLVYFTIDTAWFSFRGMDLIKYVKRLDKDDRITQFHIKEYDGSANVTPSPPVGSGVINWKKLFLTIKDPDKYWYILESERQTDPKASAMQAYDFLATLKTSS